MKISRDILRNELDLPYNDDITVEDEIVDHSRWSVHHQIIFKYNGKYYRAMYSTGATEQQWEEPWEYVEEVECTEVHKVKKVMETWEPVEKEATDEIT